MVLGLFFPNRKMLLIGLFNAHHQSEAASFAVFRALLSLLNSSPFAIFLSIFAEDSGCC